MSSKAETLASINQDLQAQLDHIEDTDSHVRTIKLLTMKLEEATQQSAQLRLNCADVEVLRRHLQKISDERKKLHLSAQAQSRAPVEPRTVTVPAEKVTCSYVDVIFKCTLRQMFVANLWTT